ncbi:heme biosynthesis protein HemY [Methylocella silvestris]|uniref:Heme biosynthesis protein HemY n=1 Tax=Methylocella silvestris TaxID=199596 RepID=A0A2J7TCT9_METSI|nr:heme biosynthesis HemY N-terminal domain-containing protein [Methylocella silvestris]PNG24584.1 heme biosynthesis protein HemY [Methylocella silvestris]
MIRVLLFLAVLICLAIAEAWLIERPGELVLNWQGYKIETSVLMGIAAVFVAAAILLGLWMLLSFIFNIPSLMSLASRGRRRDKGYAALSRGMIAVGAGDTQAARRAAAEAQRMLPHEPLALLLKAQAAQLSGETGHAEAAFTEMTKRNDMRLLGLRGLHVEAGRQGDIEKAQGYAEAAREIAPLPWASKATFEHKVAAGDWRGALALLENGAEAKNIDKPVRERSRAVLETAIAIEKADAQPAEALTLARAAVKRAPTLVPAVALAARLTGEQGDARKAAKLIEAGWAGTHHPDIARIYVGLYPGESSADRLKRAISLAQLAPREPESKIMVAGAAIAAGDFRAAREAMQPLIEGPERPTARMCRLMAELEEKQHGARGYIREWLTRASLAPPDPTWVADGVASDQWRPISPVTGRLDAFVWQKPVERLNSGNEAEDAIFAQILPPEPPLLLEEAQAPSGAKTQALEESPHADPEVAIPLGGPPAAIEPSATPAPQEKEQDRPKGLAHLFDAKVK